ncbi:MAG: DUF2726 domain-containing protein [Pseudomonadota bacterium]
MEIAIVLMVLLITIAVVALKLSDNTVSFPFSKKQQLFSAAERQFLQLIEAAIGDEFRVLCRVRLVDLVSLKTNTNKKIANSALLRAEGKKVDFVLCDRKDLCPVLAIDLVYGQGKESHKVQRDFFVTSSLDAASIPHARIQVKAGYTLQQMRECIETKLIPLRRQQGKLPLDLAIQNKALATKKKRLTRPLSPNRSAMLT